MTATTAKRCEDKGNCKYDLDNIPLNTVCIDPTPENIERYRAAKEAGEATLWGGGIIPLIGDRVAINFNQLGTGTVESYFTEHGWVGVCVLLDKVPDWKKKQQKDT